MIENFDIIKHERFLDVAFEVTGFYEAENNLLLAGKWINQGFVESFYITGKLDAIRIKYEDLNKWLKLKDKSIKCYRNGEWITL